MGTQGTGRKRSTKKERSTAEDDALNLIAREAEARLAAKRAARAEAREIRMKELERQQKELSDDDERMSVGSRGSVRVEDRDYLEKGSRAASALTAATLTSLGGTSSRRGSGETAITVDAETSLREIKEIHELKDQIQDVETKYSQNLKEAKDALAEVEEKYRKAMVSNAQLDNEKNNLMYQVDTLKDSLMELEELLSESRRGYEEKVKEYEREKHAHTVLQFQFSEMKETLKQSEELLNKHGIVLGPDLNINGDVGETQTDGTSGGDSAAQPAQDSHTSPTEGNSMLGSTEETQLRSSGEEEVDPEQHQEILEEAEKNQLSSETLCNVSAVETSSKEQPTEEQQTCSLTEKDSVGETESNDLQVDMNENPITEAKDIIVCSSKPQEIVTSPEENIPSTEILEGGDLGETSNPDLLEMGTKSSGVDRRSDDIRETCNNLVEVQGSKQEEVEESNLRNKESCHQQKVTDDVMEEPDESIQTVSNTEPHQEPENAEDAENDEAEEISSKSQPQGATASGKKKKRKRRGKKKGGPNEEKKQQKDAKEENGKDKENGKTEKDVKSATRDNGSTTEPDTDVCVTETLKESKMDVVMNDAVEGVEPTETFSHTETLKESRADDVKDKQKEEQSLETEAVDVVEAVTPTENVSLAETLNESKMDEVMNDAVDAVEGVEPTETFSHTETLKESRVDHVTDEQKEEQSLETEAVDVVEAPTENVSLAETLNESRTDHLKDEQDMKQTSETEKIEELASNTSPDTEASIRASDLIDNSKGTESTDDLDKECTSSVDNSNSGDITTKGNVHTESGIVKSETKDNMSAALSSTDDFTDGRKSLSGSEPSAATNSGSDDMPIEVSDRSPEEAAETAKDDEEPGAETDQETFAPSQDDNSELKLDRSEKEELNEDLREVEDFVEPDNSSHDALETEESPLETQAQAEHLDNVESQTVQCANQIDESNAQVSSETEQISTSEIIKTPDSPKEATEMDSLIEQEHNSEESAAAEDPEHKISQNDQESEKCQQESSKDKSEDDDSSQPTQQDSDEEDGDDEEGQSFDFDDMDIEAVTDIDSPKYPEQEDVEEAVEVTSDECNDGSSSNIESNEKTQDEPVNSKDKKCTADQVDAPDKESDTKPQDNQNSSAHEETTSENVEKELQENVGVADIKKGEVSNVGESAVVESNSAENINQATSSPVEEGLDAVKHELQGDVSPKSAGQVSSNKAPPLSGKDVKKNGKKGKSKGKEDCKMS